MSNDANVTDVGRFIHQPADLVYTESQVELWAIPPVNFVTDLL